MIKQKTLVLVKDGLAERSLGIVSNCHSDSVCQVVLVAPEKARGLQVSISSASLMAIAENIDLKDVSEKIAPVILRLAKAITVRN